MDDSVITCDRIIELYDTMKKQKLLKSYNNKKETCKTQKFYNLLTFLLIFIILLIAVSIYCYLMKYRAKWKYLVAFQDRNNEFKQVLN